jgi:signal transduction histidine kinase
VARNNHCITMLAGLNQEAVVTDGHDDNPDKRLSGWQYEVLDALTAHVAVLDGEGVILAANRAWKRFASEQGEQLNGSGIGMNYLVSMRACADQGEDSAVDALAGLNVILAGQESHFEMEYLCHAQTGARWFQMRVSPLPANSGCIVSHVDISASKHKAAELQQALAELTQAREQLVLSEKMASLGLLAAGVAHEINNPVGYLHSNLGTLRQYVKDVLRMAAAYEGAMPSVTDPVANEAVKKMKQETDFQFVLEDMPKLLAESQEGTHRVRRIVQDLKDFAHAGSNEEWQWSDLRHSLERTLNIVHNELKYKAEVHQDFRNIPDIRCLPGQLSQVFMNLLVNAAHAIDSSGQVRVSTYQKDEYVWVDIADTGCGMPPDVIKRIFEPFFTTKPMGKGTGLGLSISHGIVEKHGGHIEVESEVGRGTTFRIALPIAGPAVGPEVRTA